MLVIRSVAAITLVFYAGVVHTRLLVPRRSLWLPLALVGVCDVGAYSAVAYGFSASPQTSVVAILSSTFSLVTLLLARLFLKERLTPLQKASAFTIVTGIVLVSVRA